ncbi:substrate-binding domain-containing protein Ecym_8208 [Eremothecium cymbalariae DBVPG|uniref:Solute-binding protein family 3/N-terminal domain-containing protein n=1 Tax=Eremothecium cymbalariae (strain CBS 270.75 / DBVPG 7215 / KCTC 17166 / NRRL Y-17582) TaxID=931890 RepID=G8JXB9_ERECY|nr:Hypothetical protein Ecym_8208 [Eremothecium cymbalariae DBVPG\
MVTVRVGYIPEHFSTPIIFAREKGFFREHGLDVELTPYPSGSGHLIQSLEAGELDIAVGLSEAFVRGIADTPEDAVSPGYQIVGSYVKSPLNWAVSTSVSRDDITTLSDLDGAKIGVSRIGSGSYVMSFVLALQQNYQSAFESHPLCNTFAGLREAVDKGVADAFLWEYFTSKKYYESKEIKMVGNIHTPWPSWVLVKSAVLPETPTCLFTSALSQGIAYFQENPEEAIALIVSEFDYSEADAREWLSTVGFNNACHEIHDRYKLVDNTLEVLNAAGVLRHAANPDLIERNIRKGIYILPAAPSAQ